MKGVVLAAGKGTRLYPVTKVVAKPLLPLANRLTMEYAFDQFRSCSVSDVCVVVGVDNEQQMRETLGDGSAFGMSLSYAVQMEPKGLAHATLSAKPLVGDEEFILYLGDAIYGESLAPFVEQFRASGAANLNLVKAVDDPRRFGVAEVEGGVIVRVVEKPAEPKSNLAMAGFYVFGPQIWDVMPHVKPSARGEYEITDAIQELINRGHKVVAGVYEGEWFDTGTLPSFLATSRFLTKGVPLVDPSARVEGEVGDGTVVGAGAHVVCAKIADTVVLPGSVVRVDGEISGSLLGGSVTAEGLRGEVQYGT